jgi:AGCS family alanine or glycine:cation symporter
MLGGAQRILKVSDRIVPLKVGLFFVSAILVLLYHWQTILPSLQLIFTYAFTPQAALGGALGYSIQSAMRFGIVRTLNASEIGLGTAAVLFGGSDKSDPSEDGFMGMLTAFISTNCVSFLMCLILLSSGVWNNGQTSIDLVITAYETVFGSIGGWIVTFLSMTFGLGVLVAYAYICRACWFFMTNGRFSMLYSILFSLATFWGAMANVDVVWNSIDLVNAGLIICNVFGILYLLPALKNGLKLYEKEHKKDQPA